MAIVRWTTPDDSTNSVVQLGTLATASLAAIWIENQADSVFKFLESTLVFHDSAPSDNKAIDVAGTGHDFASLDTAIMQAVREFIEFEFGRTPRRERLPESCNGAGYTGQFHAERQ